MAPRPRRSPKSKTTDNPQVPSDENIFDCQGSTPPTTSQGNAVQLSVTNTPYRNLRTQVPYAAAADDTNKRARIIGPVLSRPMPLTLPSENEIAGQPESGGDKGKEKLRRTSSYYPGRGDGCGDSTHELSLLDPNSGNTDLDDLVETEEDWLGDEPIAKPTLGSPSKFSVAVASERPSWHGLDAISESILEDMSLGGRIGATSSSASGRRHVVPVGATPVRVPLPEPKSKEATPTPGLSGILFIFVAFLTADTEAVAAMGPGAISVNQPSTPESSGPPWPADTELLFAKGSSKLMLTLQYPLVRLVLQDAIDYMRAHLVLTNAFPDPGAALGFAHDSLMTAVEGHQPDSRILVQRFRHDVEYFAQLIPLPRARLSRIRGEVKDRSNAICVPAIYAIGPQTEIARIIRGQLSSYNYTFPYVIPAIAPDGIPRRMRPYRNDRIISIIRDLYFTGGSSSLATRFEDQFPTHQGADGKISQEVPISMVALVATALYATLFEWRTGEQQSREFSANTFLDVYLGHVNTLNHIRMNRDGVYHLMMADIFSQARLIWYSSALTANLNAPGNPIAELDLGALDD
ncbi:hypothetical protein EDB85DRAFT_1898293 [Lactarius pseudohatsudake]|nr:hypothetical protein EDB85DRAFT_1898293 [Lactarius pseudohatsudake]